MRTIFILSLLFACNEPSKLDSKSAIGKSKGANADTRQTQGVVPEAASPHEADSSNGTAVAANPGALPPETAGAPVAMPVASEMPATVSNPTQTPEVNLPTEAQAPAVIAGGFLVCSPTVSSKVACYVTNEKKEKLKISGPVPPDVYFIPTDAKQAKRTITYSRVETSLSPTLFVLDTNASDLGLIELYLDKTRHLTFNTSVLAGAQRMADAPEGTTANVINIGGTWDNGRSLGDRLVSNENDPCLKTSGKESIVITPATSARFEIADDDSVTTDVHLLGICGLQTTDAVAVIRLGAEILATVSLPPVGSGNLRLFANRTFNADEIYTFTIESAMQPGGGWDDFTFVDLGVTKFS